MANVKAESEKRKRVQSLISPSNLCYLEEKAPLFQRGNRTGRNEALNQCIKFARQYERCTPESVVLMALSKAEARNPRGQFTGRLRDFCEAEGIL